ncbi:WYL domain-containing protein [Mucilaginibacter gracilis]|uniref:WYL domain-containing protein n=1 Tax=Mucilaginibacter gracilis TaxID=423350 RepID=A0A495J8B8_9SPHI|nr:WYL domain-containing protein [Mucilaginibacter gracilis]RKR84269.1 WYL domain-containing protein [Mucilaginibacter gracilis]
MESKLFSIGDIVTLKMHPYSDGSTEIIISGDHIMLPPLMVVAEIYKAKQSFSGVKSDTYKYRCTWFSPKPYKFIFAEIDEDDLKLILKCSSTINRNYLKRGDKVAFKTAPIELGKKKSSLNYEDNSVNAGVGSTVINSLLSFLPPVLQLVDIEPHKSKHALTDKKLTPIRNVSALDVRINLFDPTDDKISGYTLPLEALELIEEVDASTILALSQIIKRSGFVNIKTEKLETLAKPRNIAYRGGYYFLRAYDYLLNKVEEFDIVQATTFAKIKSPFIAEAPKFDIVHKPEAATPEFIATEIADAIKDALASLSYIRIKYKSRNDQLSHRTLKNYNIINVKEGSFDVNYLVGYCLLRHDNRSFRIDRIQSLQKLDLSYK